MKGFAAEAEWTADLRAALEEMDAAYGARVRAVLAPYTVASWIGEPPIEIGRAHV